MIERKHQGRAVRLAGLIAAGLLLSSSPAKAAVSCSVDATPLTFGAFNTLERDVPHDSDASITVNCSSDVGGEIATYDIKLSQGAANSFDPRGMSSGAARLLYNIYTQPDMSRIWGDGTSFTDGVGGNLSLTSAGTAYSHSHTAYGRVFANQQSLPIGTYRDFVTITISY